MCFIQQLELITMQILTPNGVEHFLTEPFSNGCWSVSAALRPQISIQRVNSIKFLGPELYQKIVKMFTTSKAAWFQYRTFPYLSYSLINILCVAGIILTIFGTIYTIYMRWNSHIPSVRLYAYLASVESMIPWSLL